MRKEIESEKELIALLKQIRKEQSVSQEQLANFTGLSRKGIGKIELGHSHVKFSTLLNIAKLLGAKISIEHD